MCKKYSLDPGWAPLKNLNDCFEVPHMLEKIDSGRVSKKRLDDFIFIETSYRIARLWLDSQKRSCNSSNTLNNG